MAKPISLHEKWEHGKDSWKKNINSTGSLYIFHNGLRGRQNWLNDINSMALFYFILFF